MKALRTQLGKSGEAFAVLLNGAARRHRWPATYTKSKVSLMESEKRDLSPEDLAVLEEVDPDRRGWRWFAFGVTNRTVGRFALQEQSAGVRQVAERTGAEMEPEGPMAEEEVAKGVPAKRSGRKKGKG